MFELQMPYGHKADDYLADSNIYMSVNCHNPS